MSKIDDPFDQIESQNRDDDSPARLATVLNVTSLLVGLLDNPRAALSSALGTVTAFGIEFVSERRREARFAAFQNGFREAIGELSTRVDVIEKKAVSPDAEDAIVAAIQNAGSSARLDRARRYGRIVGGTLAQESPDWQEAAQFIRSLEQLTESDIETLKLLWKVQRVAYRPVSTGSGQLAMSTSANDYTSTWKSVLEVADKAAILRDDWDSRCGRLAGFGLTSAVQPNPSHQSPDMICFRLTGRAVRLLGLFGRNINPGAYPSVRYHREKGTVTVHDEDADRALGDGWFDTPAKFLK